MRDRRGVALLVVLTAVAAIAVVGTLTNETARHGVAAAGNRIELTRAAWLAEGCVAEALAVMEDWLARAPMTRWSWMDSALASATPSGSESASSRTPGCEVRLRPRGMALDVNRSTSEQIAAMLRAAGAPRPERLASDITDWRDSDDVSRSHAGSEPEWYLREARVPPRNEPFASAEEVLLVRGAEHVPGIDSLLGVDETPVVLSRAPAVVLAGLPGMSREAIHAILDARRETPFPDMATIAARLSNDARQRLQAALPALHQLATGLPSTWLLTVAAPPAANPRATVELVLARDANRIAIVRWRSWP
jgi:type II secretory pathway component PulK